MIRAAYAAGVATIATAVVAVLVGLTHEATDDVVMLVGHLRAIAVAGAVTTALFWVGARIIAEIRASGAADALQREGARLLRQSQGE